ncbi:AKAP1 protein, partial [Columbina picui]|nr:AKAP1 protein [Columbina picui]
STVPYSNGILNEDGPDLGQECSRAAGMDGDHSGGKGFGNTCSALIQHCLILTLPGLVLQELETWLKLETTVLFDLLFMTCFLVPFIKELVGRLIGKQGRYMTYLRQMSGAKIYVSTLPYFRDSQVCHIEGSSQQVEKALSLIGKKFKELCLTNIYAVPPPAPLTLHSLLMTAWVSPSR